MSTRESERALFAKIKQTIEQLGFSSMNVNAEITKQISRHLHRIVLMGTYKSQKAVFRCYVDQSEESGSFFKSEMESLKEFERHNLSFGQTLFQYDANEYWLLENYVEGNPSGKWFNYSDNFIKTASPDKLVLLLLKVKECEPNISFKSVSLRTGYQNELDLIMRNWPFASNELISRWQNSYDERVEKLLNDKSFSHADINVGNILFRTTGDVCLIDWETARYDSYSRDFASAYFRAYDFPEWQKLFLKSIPLTDSQYSDLMFLVGLYLAKDICVLSSMANDNKRMLREGEIPMSRLRQLIERNILKLKELQFD